LVTDDPHPEFRLTLSNYKGVQYYAPITLNNQKMSAVYDTGSFEIMAISEACTVCKVANLLKYDNKTSNTFVKGHRPIENHHFAGGLVVGRQDFETVHVGDVGKALVVKNMPFWQVIHTEMRVWMSNRARFTAIVGLGHRTSVPDAPEGSKPVPSLLERTDTNRFAVCLQRGPQNPGYIFFNPTSTKSFTAASVQTGMYKRIPVIGKNHWAVRLNEVSTTNGKVTEKRCGENQPCIAIVDSGTSLIGVPPMAVPMVMGLLKAIKQDCSNLNELQDLVFDLGGHKFVMPGAAYVVQFRVDKVRKCLPAFTDFDMMSGQGSVWILGMPFLRHFYTVFDRTEPSIYVAEQGDNCNPVAHNSTASHFFNTSSFQHHTMQEPTIADTSEASLPSWAYGSSKLMEI